MAKFGPIKVMSEEEVNGQYWYILNEDAEKQRKLAHGLVKLLNISLDPEIKSIFMGVTEVLEKAVAVLSVQKPIREPLATEKPKFDNRPAGTRWR